MPATVVAFRSVPNPALPRKVYVDTTFITGLINWRPETADVRLIAIRDIYDRLWKSNRVMWSSPLSVEEVVWEFVRRELVSEMSKFTNIQNIGVFKRQRRGDFERVLEALQPSVTKL